MGVDASRERVLFPEVLACLERAQGVAFVSPSAARAYARQTPRGPKAACIGPSTGEEARRLGFAVWEAVEPGLEGLFQAIRRALS